MSTNRRSEGNLQNKNGGVDPNRLNRLIYTLKNQPKRRSDQRNHPATALKRLKTIKAVKQSAPEA